VNTVADSPEEELVVKADIVEEAAETEPTDADVVPEEVVAQTVNITEGGAQTVKAEKVIVEQGGIAHAEAQFIDVKQGGIGIAQGENVSITDGGVGIIAAENVKMTDAVAVLVAANKIEGEDITILFDVRAAVVFALVLGVVNSLFKLIGRRKG